MKIREWRALVPEVTPESAVVALPGRGNTADQLLAAAKDLCLEKSLLFVGRPEKYQWYPKPVSAVDQEDAVAGLNDSLNEIENVVTMLNGLGIPKQKIALMGFSAGAVMSLYTAMHSNDPYAGVVSLCGAILEPDNVPECKFTDVPYLLVHNEDDDCFKWDERYVPYRDSLLKNNYNVITEEDTWGGHMFGWRDIVTASNVLAPRLGYGDDWEHPKTDEL